VTYPALLVDVAIFVLSLWVGLEVISKVPATLHTPLMSAANSIHGIVLAGAMLIAVTANNALGYVIAFVAAAFAAMNVVGGYVVTGRMLKMFRKRPTVRAAAAGAAPAAVSAAANGAGQQAGNGQGRQAQASRPQGGKAQGGKAQGGKAQGGEAQGGTGRSA
jgi:H+-translocating NAD(P) transhydrogenase subunit alpha